MIFQQSGIDLNLLMLMVNLQELLVSNMAQNLPLVMQVAKEYSKELDADRISAMIKVVYPQTFAGSVRLALRSLCHGNNM